MVVELISVGTEILLGNIVNTNAAYLSKQCADLGLSCFYQSVVGDNDGRLREAVRIGLSRADIVIFTGGLGPTQDDLTKETVAEVMNKRLVMDEDSKDHLIAYFDKRGIELTVNNWKQAMVPDGSMVLMNENGTAPGIIMEENGKIAVLLPGPPNELIPMFENQVKPYLLQKTDGVLHSVTVKLCGVGESKVETMIEDLINQQSNPTIATYAKTGEVHIRITAKEADENKAKQLIKPLVKEVKKRFGTHVYTTDEDVTLEQAVVELLMDKGFTLTTAESCTGGMIAARLTDVPGVSEIYKTGFVTYANKSKKRELGVKKKTLKEHGAVSPQVAFEMAKGALEKTKAQVSLSVTGIAGPGGGSDEKPVGLVYIGCNVCGKIVTEKYNFNGNRAKVRESTVVAALTLLRKCVMEFKDTE